MNKILLIFVVFSLISTATAVVACGTCVYGAVTLIPAGVRMTKPTTKTLANTAAGCRRMNVVCTLPQPGMMEFNRAKAGPYEGKSITVLLTCGADKKWRFTNNGAVTFINTVACYY